MSFLLVHVLSSPAKEWVDEVKEHIIRSYSVKDIRGIDPHMTLKYDFDEKDLAKIEGICWSMTKTHRAARFTLNGFDAFGKKVIFFKVDPSEEMRSFYHDLFEAVQRERVPFAEVEKKGIHFHVTLAADVHPEQYTEILKYLHTQEHRFPLQLDNLTILRYENDVFTVHRRYDLRK
jgi:2'-5' RNA ligase